MKNIVFVKNYLDNTFSAAYESTSDSAIKKLISLKLEHTYKVYDLAIQIGKELKLSDHELEIIGIIALMHDISRAYQLTHFSTMNENVNYHGFDHGDYSAYMIEKKIMEDDSFLSGYTQEDISSILLSVKYHNKADLPRDCSQLTLRMAKLIKDADKVDIFRVLCEREKLYSYDGEFNDAAIKEFESFNLISHENIKNDIDHYLLHLALIFQVYYHETYKYLKPNYLRFLNKIQTSKLDYYINFSKKYLEEKI